MIFFKLLSYFHIKFRFLKARKKLMKSKSLPLPFAFSSFFFRAKGDLSVLIQSIRKDDRRDFCVINKITSTHLVISDPCQNKSVCFENDTKQFLSIKNIYNS